MGNFFKKIFFKKKIYFNFYFQYDKILKNKNHVQNTPKTRTEKRKTQNHKRAPASWSTTTKTTGIPQRKSVTQLSDTFLFYLFSTNVMSLGTTNISSSILQESHL